MRKDWHNRIKPADKILAKAHQKRVRIALTQLKTAVDVCVELFGTVEVSASRAGYAPPNPCVQLIYKFKAKE
jgi:hypothetical protein